MDILVDTLLSLLPHSRENEEEGDDNFINIEDEEIDQAETRECDEPTHGSEAVLEIEETSNEHHEASDDFDGAMDDDAMFRMECGEFLNDSVAWVAKYCGQMRESENL